VKETFLFFAAFAFFAVSLIQFQMSPSPVEQDQMSVRKESCLCPIQQEWFAVQETVQSYGVEKRRVLHFEWS